MPPHLGVVMYQEQAVGLRVQNKVPPQKLAAVLILLDVQKPTDSVLPDPHKAFRGSAHITLHGGKGEAEREEGAGGCRSG